MLMLIAEPFQRSSIYFDHFIPALREELRPLSAPWLVATIDVYTGMITGAYLSLAHPNRLSILETLVQSILAKTNAEEKYEPIYDWLIQGYPVLILVDNGMDYRAEDVRRFCKKYDIIIEYAPIKKPQYKTYIEQWFNTLRKGLETDEVPVRRPPFG